MPLYLDEESRDEWALQAAALFARVDTSGEARIREELRLRIPRQDSVLEVVIQVGIKAWFPNYTDPKEPSRRAVRTADHCVFFWDGHQLTLKKKDGEFVATPVNLYDRPRANAY